MYKRLLKKPLEHPKSFFLFGPRGTGKTSWIKEKTPNSLYLDLLETDLYIELLARPERLRKMIPENFSEWIVLDEVQKIPSLLNEVHRLIEKDHCKFILTGSSSRSLKRKGVNLLAGRALTYQMFPLTVKELGKDFNIKNSLQYGHLPSVFSEDPKKYLESYVQTYLREEVLQEGLTRNLGAFSRFLEIASFSQGSILNITEIAREASIHRKVAESYFHILEDLLLAHRIFPFSKKAKRKTISHPKFYYFDVGVFQILRPKGPLDMKEEIDGTGLETLVFQELLAMNHYLDLGYRIYYWRTQDQKEVDFVLYGEKGLLAIEVKRKEKISFQDLKNLKAFQEDYPMAKLFLLYGGTREENEDGIRILPIEKALSSLEALLV